jgi:hypothetical protein
VQSLLQVYDPVTDNWNTKAPMPTAREGAAAGVIDGKLYVVGGQNENIAIPGNSDHIFNKLEVYDPASDTWSTRAPMPTARISSTAGVVNGILYVAGGNNGLAQLNIVEAYDPVSNTWTTCTPMPETRDGPFSGVFDGVFYVAGGGISGDGPSNTLWGFTPPVANRPPSANAGDNRSILSKDQATTTLAGTASDPEGDPLTYRWLEGTTELSGWQPVQTGQAPLNLGALPFFSRGQHTLTLEVNDTHVTSRDPMVLTVENSAPIAAPTGAGTYQVNTPVSLAGEVSDFDGDYLTYQWREGTTVLSQGLAQGISGGQPVSLTPHLISSLPVGSHQITLQVSDGTNPPVGAGITVNIVDIDTNPPTLAPVADKTILWPPNNKMVPVTITTNAQDNSGLAVTLTASVSCNEPNDGSQYWTQPVIDQATGIITLQLQAARLGKGTGRQYTINLVAADQSGNKSAAQVVITVPHDQGKN